MTIKSITYEQIEKAIHISLCEDINVYKFYDPDVKVETIEEIVVDISRKIKTFDFVILKGVYEKGELIGYFAYRKKMLISFALSMKYRVRKYLREFFNTINKELKKDFICFLWGKNIRAVRWLEKNGMEAVDYAPGIVKLVCPKHELIYT